MKEQAEEEKVGRGASASLEIMQSSLTWHNLSIFLEDGTLSGERKNR